MNNMSEWISCTLGDLITFQRGHDLPKAKMSGSGYPVVGSNGIIGYHNEYTTEAPSITIGRSGNVGNPFIVYSRSWSHNTSLYIKEFKSADPIFIYYFLKTLDLGHYAGGSAVPTLNRNHIHTLPVSVPKTIEEQKKIGLFLKALDDKIELNNRINENLSRQLRLLFQHTFLDTEHPEWPVERLGNFLSLERGLSYKGKFLSDSEGVPMVNLGNILPNSEFRPEKLKFYTGDFKEKVAVKPGDIVVANTDLTQDREVLGSAILIPDLGYPTIICSHHISIVRDCKISKHFIHGMLNSPSYRERVIGFATGTTVLALPGETILNCEFSLPPDELIAEYDSIAESFFQKSEQLRKEIQQLKQVRDCLLPQLMSDQLDVSEVSL